MPGRLGFKATSGLACYVTTGSHVTSALLSSFTRLDGHITLPALASSLNAHSLMKADT